MSLWDFSCGKEIKKGKFPSFLIFMHNKSWKHLLAELKQPPALCSKQGHQIFWDTGVLYSLEWTTGLPFDLKKKRPKIGNCNDQSIGGLSARSVLL